MTQEKCDKAVNACLPALRCVPNWFVTNKMLEKLDNTIFCNDDIIFANEDSDNVTCFSDGMGLYTLYPNNVNLDTTLSPVQFLKKPWYRIIPREVFT